MTRGGELAETVELQQLDAAEAGQLKAYLALYHQLFPEWEREPDELVRERHLSGDYFTRYLSDGEGMVGFFTINVVPALRYSTLTFIGVRPNRQGTGLGAKLLDAALEDCTGGNASIEYFLIEAEPDKAGFYLSHGLKRVDIRYRVPRFDDKPGLEPMELFMHEPGAGRGEEIPLMRLKEIIAHLLEYGYGLPPGDPRTGECVKWQGEGEVE